MIFHSISNLFDNTDLMDHPVAVRNSAVISFKQFRADVASCAHKYQNCRAALICEDSYNFLVGFFGLLYGGSSFIASSVSQPSISGILQQECSVVIDDAAIANMPHADFLLLPPDANKLCIDFFTSGSTGDPKRVSKSLAKFAKEIEIIDTVFLQEPGTVFATVPHYHVYGLVYKLLWPLSSRHPFDTETQVFWENFLEFVTTGSIIISSPVHLRRLEGISPLLKKNIPAQIFSAGSQLNTIIVEDIKNILGVTPTEIFGSTETGSIASRYPIQQNQPWRTLPGILVQKGGDGRMILLSPYVGDDWHVTEDLIDLADEGFHFLGRADGVVKVEGRRISLAKVENGLCNLVYIQEAVVTVPPNKPNHLVAVVVLSPEGQSLLSELGNFRFSRLLRKELAHSIERISMPRLWRFVSSIPTNGIGKRNMDELHALFRDPQ